MLVVFAVPALPASAVTPQTLYGCDGADQPPTAPAVLYTVNPSSGAVTLIGSMVNDYGCSAMDFSPGGTLYAGGIDVNGFPSLFTVNTLTGVATEVGESNQGTCSSGVGTHQISDMAFSPSGTLYALFVTIGGVGSHDPCLGTLNTSTGAETDVGLTGMFHAGDALAFSVSSVLYGADALNLYTVNQGTGVASKLATWSGGVDGNGICSTTPITPTGSPVTFPHLQPIDAMKFNLGGVLYGTVNCGVGLAGGNTFLVTIALNGVITVIGQTGVSTPAALVPTSIDGIAFGMPPGSGPSGVPEFPFGAAILFALIVPMLLLLRKRNQAFGRPAI